MNSEDAVISSINGSVQSQGIKVTVDNWLKMGCDEWKSTPEEVRAYAYQAARITGWTDKALCSAISRVYPHLDNDMMKFVIEELQALAKQHPLQVEQNPNKKT